MDNGEITNEEIDSIMRQFEDINLIESLDSNISECQSIIFEKEIIEQVDETNEDFLEENDIFTKNNKNNNPNYNKYLGVDGKLNNKEIIKFDENVLKEGILEIFVKLNIKELIENNNYFKRQNNFIQCINLLKNTNYFCFTYKLIEGCSFFSNFKVLDKFYQPFISISLDDIDKFYQPFISISLDGILNNTSFDIIFNNIFQNSYKVCINCGYGKDERIIPYKSKSYYNIISDIKNPLFLFFVCDFLNINVANTNSYNQQELLEFKKRIIYINKLITYFKNTIILNNSKYRLIGIITTPTSNHYTGCLINLESNIYGLKSNTNYYYDILNSNKKIKIN